MRPKRTKIAMDDDDDVCEDKNRKRISLTIQIIDGTGRKFTAHVNEKITTCRLKGMIWCATKISPDEMTLSMENGLVIPPSGVLLYEVGICDGSAIHVHVKNQLKKKPDDTWAASASSSSWWRSGWDNSAWRDYGDGDKWGHWDATPSGYHWSSRSHVDNGWN